MNPICPYCGKPSEKVTGKEIYPRLDHLHGKTFYRCKPCDAYVGCHPGTEKPLGSPANRHLRLARSQAHDVFDRRWKGGLSRSAAYAWLAKKLRIPVDQCHIGQFDLARCQKVIEVCKDEGETK
jgi:hypothetical protein